MSGLYSTRVTLPEMEDAIGLRGDKLLSERIAGPGAWEARVPTSGGRALVMHGDMDQCPGDGNSMAKVQYQRRDTTQDVLCLLHILKGCHPFLILHFWLSHISQLRRPSPNQHCKKTPPSSFLSMGGWLRSSFTLVINVLSEDLQAIGAVPPGYCRCPFRKPTQSTTPMDVDEEPNEVIPTRPTTPINVDPTCSSTHSTPTKQPDENGKRKQARSDGPSIRKLGHLADAKASLRAWSTRVVRAQYTFLTPAAFLPDGVLTALASNATVRTIDDLDKAIRWAFTRRHGEEVLAILRDVDSRERSRRDEAKRLNASKRRQETLARHEKKQKTGNVGKHDQQGQDKENKGAQQAAPRSHSQTPLQGVSVMNFRAATPATNNWLPTGSGVFIDFTTPDMSNATHTIPSPLQATSASTFSSPFVVPPAVPLPPPTTSFRIRPRPRIVAHPRAVDPVPRLLFRDQLSSSASSPSLALSSDSSSSTIAGSSPPPPSLPSRSSSPSSALPSSPMALQSSRVDRT
ncbi:hypothetical protein CVT26_004562 [Gymnopilus dilepis]|uniref:Uncharacterized protein n=1 Tax=Gymnopilus dilepis TaxID=231916 RepID=A0A409YJB2_9AGAR|nr:hypothetical protein CVT26_004562 [Gymnopilus dilepis]